MPKGRGNSTYRGASGPQGQLPKWLGKKPDSPITPADIAKGKASGYPHVVKMATFAANAKKWH